MIKNVKVTNPLGETLLLELRSPERSGFFVRGIEGLGPTKADINTTEVLSADGSFFNSARSQSRNIVFNLGFYNWHLQSIESLRQQTYRFFPMKKLITIEVETDNRIAITTGYVESNSPDIFSKDEDTQISILCPAAFFYAKSWIETVFSGSDASFEFPWENPSLTLPLIEFGQVYIDDQKALFYDGDEDTGVVITIYFLGSVGDFYIYNFTTNQIMHFETPMVGVPDILNPIAGDTIIISTLRGAKSATLIRSGISYNILNSLGAFSDWFRVQKGDNVFGYSADVGQENIQMSISHRIVYGGI